MMVGSWITNNDKSWLLEFLGVLIGKGTWGPLSSEVVSLGVGGELKNSSLGILSVGDNEDISWVINSSDDSSSDHHLLPGLGDVQIVDTLLVSGIDVWHHLLGAILGSNMDSGSEHKSEILRSGLGVRKVCAHFY